MKFSTPKIAFNPWYKTIGKTFRWDIIAGLTLWGLVVPEAMAYSSLADAPAQAGIYAVIFVVGMYAIFGTSPLLVASSTSAAAATVGGIVASASSSGSPAEKAAIVAAVSICVGLIYFFSGALRLGFITRFISVAVHTGFMFGLALFIVISQLPKLMGLGHLNGNAISKVVQIIEHLGKINWYTLAVGAIALALMFTLSRVAPRVPGGIVAIIFGIAAVKIFNLANDHGVKTVGKIPNGLPKFVLPDLSVSVWGTILIGSFGVVLVGLSEAASVEQNLADRRGEDVHLNRDMMAFGIGNTLSGLFGGLVGAGSLSATSLNESAGAKSSFSSFVAAIMALVTVLWLSGVLTDLPEAVLGALVIHAVADHIRLTAVSRLRMFGPMQFGFALFTAAGVLLFDVLAGLLLSMVGSLIYYVYRTSRLQVLIDPDREDTLKAPRSIVRHPDAHKGTIDEQVVLEPHHSDHHHSDSKSAATATKASEKQTAETKTRDPKPGADPVHDEYPNILTLAVVGRLFYANAAVLSGGITKAVVRAEEAGRKIDTVLVHMSGQYRIDLTSAAMLDQLSDKLAKKGITLELVNTGPHLDSELDKATKAAPHEAPATHKPATAVAPHAAPKKSQK